MQLKPCPFCGGEPRYTTVHFAGDSFYTVSCDCGMHFTDDTDVAERWNTRATETPNRERIIELVEELSDLVGGGIGE